LNNLDNSRQDCKCALNLPYRKYLKEWFIFQVGYLILLLVLFGFSNEACWHIFTKYPFIYGSMFVFAFIGIIVLIRLFLYIRLLRNNCSCGYGNKEAFIYWYLIIIFFMFALAFALILLMYLFNN
jgi:hypothetical protein